MNVGFAGKQALCIHLAIPVGLNSRLPIFYNQGRFGGERYGCESTRIRLADD